MRAPTCQLARSGIAGSVVGKHEIRSLSIRARWQASDVLRDFPASDHDRCYDSECLRDGDGCLYGGRGRRGGGVQRHPPENSGTCACRHRGALRPAALDFWVQRLPHDVCVCLLSFGIHLYLCSTGCWIDDGSHQHAIRGLFLDVYWCLPRRSIVANSELTDDATCAAGDVECTNFAVIMVCVMVSAAPNIARSSVARELRGERLEHR